MMDIGHETEENKKNLRVLCGGNLLLFLAIWVFLLCVGRSAMLRDPGSFWHLVNGQTTLSSGHVPHEDVYSFTLGGRPLVDDQWLAECGMAIVYRVAGWDGLLLLATAILAAVYTWIGRRMLQNGLHWLPVGVLLSLLFLIGSPQFHVRPLIVTTALMAVTFAWLVDVESGRRRVGQLWWLVPMFILWTNLHGGVIGGIGTVGLWIAGQIFLLFFWGDKPEAASISPLPGTDPKGWSAGEGPGVRAASKSRRILESLALLLALLASTLINPYGIGLPLDWYKTLSMPLPSIIVEHLPMDVTDPTGAATVSLAIIYVVVLAGSLPRRPRITWLIPLIWLVLAFQRVRNAPLFALTAGIALADMLPYSRVGEWMKGRDLLTAAKTSVGWRAAVAPILIVVAAFVLPAMDVGRGWAGFDPQRWPVELLPQLEEINGASEDGSPIFNDLNLGGFLIYHAPRLRVFIDDRCSLYGTEFLQNYLEARRETPGQIDRWRQKYGFSYALVEAGGDFDKHLSASPAWSAVARTPAATLYQYRPKSTTMNR